MAAPLPTLAPAETFVFPPNRILVPMDLSDASTAAWACAHSLCRRFGCESEAFYVQPWQFSVAGMGIVEPYMTTEIEREALAELRRRLGPSAVVRGDIGAVEASILTESRGFDMIVAGSHGRSSWERALRGSIAEALIRDSNKPVLIGRGPLGRVRRVLAPINFEPYSWAAFVMAARAAAAFGAELAALHVVDQALARGADVQGPTRLLDSWIDSLPEGLADRCSSVRRVDYGSAAECIAWAAQECDMVVLAAHRRGVWADAFGTTAQRVLRHCPVPVLAVPSSARR